jgi:cobalamin biosynthesis protein CobT
MKDRTLQRAFPIVAAAIGQRFGIKVRVGGDEAFTNGKVIQLPGYDGDDPDYKDFAWGLLAHESFHIRYSDFGLEFGDRPIRRRLCGAIEDVRIEFEGAKEYPGTRLTLRKVVEKMVAKGEFKRQQKGDHPGDILLGYVLKSLRSRVLGQSALKALLDETEKALESTFPKGAIIRLKGLLSEVPVELTCEQDCLSLTDRILDMIEEEERKESEQKANNPNSPPSGQDNPGQPGESGGGVTSPSLGQVGNTAENQGNDPGQDSQESSPSPGQGNGENGDVGKPNQANGDGNDAGSGEDDGGKPAKPSSPTPENPSGSDGGSQPTGDSDNSSSGKPGNGCDGQDDGEDHQIPNRNGLVQKILNTTDDELEPDMFDTVKDLLKIDASQETTICLPNGEEPPRNDAFGMSLYRKAEGESGKIRAALQGIVQSHRRNRPVRKRSGNRIDARQLHKLPTGDTRIFGRMAHKPNPNTAIHLVIDCSESMSYPANDAAGRLMGPRLPLALDAAMALAMAFEGIPGVNTGITAFPGHYGNTVYTVLRHGQRLRPNVGAFALTADGSTPMAEAVWFAAASLLSCREPRKVLMVLTDGQPDDRLSALDILDRCQRSGIEAVGIGLGIDVSHLFTKSIVVNDIRELRTELFALAEDLLITA